MFKIEEHLSLLIILICLVSLYVEGSAQNVYIDDIVGVDMPWQFTHFIDSLESHGAIIHFRSIEGWTTLNNMDMLWLNHPDYPWEEVSITEIMGFAQINGRIVMTSGSDTYSSTYNPILTDTRWQSTAYIAGRCSSSFACCFYQFPPLTNRFDNIVLPEPAIVECGDNAYPFGFIDSNNEEAIAAISYPFLYEGDCSTFVILVTGTHRWKLFYISDPEEYRFGTNILLTGAGVPGYELEPCAVPEPFIIHVDSCAHCANPGDTITLTGNNLWQGSNENIGGDIEIYIGDTVIIPIEYSHYAPNCSTLTNTWLQFICPELPDGNYFIQLGHKAILFDGGEIQIPCETTYEPDSCLAHPLPFSPNGDGINDYCKFEYPGMSEDNGVVSIYSLDNSLIREVRNGDVEYSTKGIITWDGEDSEGNVVNNGVYIYIVKADGRIVCNGTVYVAR